ncbi:MAG: RepB family plasmid replication initiator protein, partial [Calditrichaeota bacterium]
MKITNKDVIQSYLLTSAKYDYSVYEKRILYRLVQICQPQIQGQKLDSRFKINKDLFNGYWVKLPISSFLKDEDDKNHSLVKKALRDLREKVFEYEDDKRWELISIIESPAIEKYSDFVEFRVHPKIYDAILDFSKGFRKYELKTAMSFESTYAMRLYELFSEKKSPITYSIEKLKIMFKIKEKYKQVNDFFRYVIEPAKRELDKSSPYSFEYSPVKEGRKIVAIKFYPVYIPENRDSEVEEQHLKSQISPSWDLDAMVINYLKQNYYFDTKEIRHNLELFKHAQEREQTGEFDLIIFLSQMRRKCADKANPKGYLINAL